MSTSDMPWYNDAWCKSEVTLRHLMPAWTSVYTDASEAKREHAYHLWFAYLQTGDLSSLVEAVVVLHEAVGMACGSANAAQLNGLSRILYQRYEWLNHLPDLEQATLASQHAVDLSSDSDPNKPEYLNNLGNSLLRRFQRLETVDDLENSIVAHRRSMELNTYPGDLDALKLANLGKSLTRLFELRGMIDNLDEAICTHRRAIDLTPDGHHDKPSRLQNLATVLHKRLRRVADIRTIDDAISVQRRLIELAVDSHPSKAALHEDLAIFLLQRFNCLGELKDIDDTVLAVQSALDFLSDDSSTEAVYLRDLSMALEVRFDYSGNYDDLEKSILIARRAIDTASDGNPELSSTLLNALGLSLHARYVFLGELVDLEGAISALDSAVSLLLDDHPDKVTPLTNLGNTLLHRFERFDILEDLDAAISLLRRADKLTSDEDSTKPRKLSNLANGLLVRFRRLGEPADCDNAITANRNAVELTPDGHPDKPTWLHNLGLSFQNRFDHLGELSDLNSAIAAEQSAILLASHGQHRSMLGSRLLYNFGYSLQMRFQRLHDLNDLNNAISAYRHAVEATPDGNPLKPSRLSNLGGALQSRFLQSQMMDIEDMDSITSAILLGTQAVELTPDDHPDKVLYLHVLGCSLMCRFIRIGDRSDIDNAVTIQHRAVELAPEDHPHYKPAALHQLSFSLQRRFMHSNDLIDLEDAISASRHAIQLTPDRRYDKSEKLFILGSALQLLFEHTQARSDFDSCMDCFLASTRLSIGRPQPRLQSAMECVSMLSAHPEFCSPKSLIEAHSCILDILPVIVWLGFSVNRRYEECAELGDLVTAAVSAAVETGAISQAVEWLEAGRSLVWSQISSLRTSLIELQVEHPELAQSLHAIQEQLQQSGYTTLSRVPLADDGFYALPGIMTDAEADRHRQLAVDYEQLLVEVRGYAGFEDFLRPKTLTALLASSRSTISGSVVFIHVSQTRCDAIALSPDGALTLVPLPDLTLERAKKLQSSYTERLQEHLVRERRAVSLHPLRALSSFDRVSELVWTWIVQPILQALNLIDTKHGNYLPHITWCPTGPLTQLPLHTAGIYSNPLGPRVYNFIVSSYTPSLAALLECSAGPAKQHRSPPSVLIVTQPATPGHAPLPGTREESRLLLEVLNNSHTSSTVIDHEQATVAAVQRVMNQYPWVHLACHGSQDQDDPTQSAFVLYDGPLSLSDLMRTTAYDAELAFLSACQTATGDDSNTEESAHLAAGMLAVGFKGVVATMWSIGDEEAPMLVEAYYKKLFELRGAGTLGKGETGAAYALHEAVKVLREKVGEKNFVKWAPFIHIGA